MQKNAERVYDQILAKHDLGALTPIAGDYTGIFLPVVPADTAPSTRRLMVVGQETRQWLGTLTHWIEASAEGKAEEYIERAFRGYRQTRRMPPSTSRFLQFLGLAEQRLQLPAYSVQWGNLIACAYRRGSPSKRPWAELEPLLELSYDLLAAQIRMFQPEAILFTTGPGYDRLIKQFSMRFGGYSNSMVMEPRRLWAFRIDGVPCFRTTHPRYAPGAATRDRALTAIAAL